MRRLVPIGLALAVLVAACGGSASDGVATLNGNDDGQPATDDTVGEQSTEEALLAFAQCMRDNGIEDFEDPVISEDGGISINGGDSSQPPTQAEREEMQQAFQACSDLLEGLPFGPGSVDRSELEDRLYEFAACMRDNGYDMPDPDLSALFPEQRQNTDGDDGGPTFQSPFGDIDPDDPAFQAAAEACRDVFGGGFFFGGGPGGPGDDQNEGPSTNVEGA